jgi:hypothetical protein
VDLHYTLEKGRFDGNPALVDWELVLGIQSTVQLLHANRIPVCNINIFDGCKTSTVTTYEQQAFPANYVMTFHSAPGISPWGWPLQ